MSDTEEEGTFDKEAEKEKLREQLRREEENRRSTQHMSELLLKGATMTNKHCDVCGDPLFRYEGREFCPTCTQEGRAGAGAEAGEGTSAEADEGTGGPASDEDAGGRGAAGIDRVATGAAGGSTAEPATPGTTESPAVDASDASTGGASEFRAVPRKGAVDGVPEDVAAARSALVRKLSSLAHQAEATDDVGRSRELLAAARETAEALAAIDAIRG